MKVENVTEWWMWTLNRKVAEYVLNPSEDQENELRFLLTSYRALKLNQPANDKVLGSRA